jgi:hypothetical protein
VKSILVAVLLGALSALAVFGFVGGPVSDCVQIGEQMAEASLAAALAVAGFVWLLPIEKEAYFKAVITIFALAIAAALAFQPARMGFFKTDVENCAAARV